MFIVLSKLLSWFVEPLHWLLLVQVFALWLVWRNRYRAATWSVALAIALCLVINDLPVGSMLIRPLERAFVFPASLPAKLDGILVLGGAEEYGLTEAHGKPQLNSEAERLTEFVSLARRHPEAMLVFSGGTARVNIKTSPADVAKRFFEQQGLDPARVVFERASGNTYESAVFTRELVRPREGQSWVLITSASHMPRAYGVFRKAGWQLIPYPVSYSALPDLTCCDARGYDIFRVAIREWIGIGAYRLTGKI